MWKCDVETDCPSTTEEEGSCLNPFPCAVCTFSPCLCGFPMHFGGQALVLAVNVGVNGWVSFHIGPAVSWGLIQGGPPCYKSTGCHPCPPNPSPLPTCFNSSKFFFQAQSLTQISGSLNCHALCSSGIYLINIWTERGLPAIHPGLLFLDPSQEPVGNHTQLTGRS